MAGFYGGGGSAATTETDPNAVKLAVVGSTVVDFTAGSATGLKLVHASDTQRIFSNTTGADITLTGATDAALLADGLTALSGGAGVYAGDGANFASLPTTREGGAALEVGDTAYNRTGDATNISGIYRWNGAAWVAEYNFTDQFFQLAQGAPVSWDHADGLKAYTLASINVSLFDITSDVQGVSYIWNVIASGGNRTVTFGGLFVDADGNTAPSYTIAAGNSEQFILTSLGGSWQVRDLGGQNVTVSTEVLTVVGQNTINPLTNIPVGNVDFHVNGSLVATGITNAGTAVTVNAGVLGYNIGLTDVITATYSS